MNKRLIAIISLVVLIIVAVVGLIYFVNRNAATTPVASLQSTTQGTCITRYNERFITTSDICITKLSGREWISGESGVEFLASSVTPPGATAGVKVYSCTQDGARAQIEGDDAIINCSGEVFVACEYADQAAYDADVPSYCSDRVRQWRIKLGISEPGA
ncbi:MAG: hypothetical protein Q8P33_03740 [bacterium]|nr:hypothetical protein [bacterium]